MQIINSFWSLLPHEFFSMLFKEKYTIASVPIHSYERTIYEQVDKIFFHQPPTFTIMQTYLNPDN